MFAIQYLVMLSIVIPTLPLPKSGCKRGWFKMCCIADYDLAILATGCVPFSSMPPGGDGNPYCGNLIGIDTETSWFENCCDFSTVFSQTCATVNGIQSCITSKPGIKCAKGGIN